MAKNKALWSAVREIIMENHEWLAKHTIRESYYLMGDLLEPLVGTRISKEEFLYFTTEDQAYSSYRDDIWTALEQKEGIVRPRAKALGTIFDRGAEYPISRLSQIWNQARGFVFTEKVEDGQNLKILSQYGWTIIAGGGQAGFPTREIRQLLKADTRPVLAFHDADNAGKAIYESLGFETKRTSHLDIALGERVTDLGLTKEDAKKLGLRSRPEPPKYRDLNPRVETSALASLEKRFNLPEYKLAYVVTKMLKLGVTLSPTEIPKTRLLESDLETSLLGAFYPMVRRAVREAVQGLAPKGTAVSVDLPDSAAIMEAALGREDLERSIYELATEIGDEADWLREKDYHKEAMKFTSKELVSHLR